MNTKLIRCRTQLLLKSPFFGTLALKLKPVAEATDSMATDGYHLFYNENFINNTPEDELTGIVCHEIMHCALQHMYRKNDRDPRKWNVACDYAINHLLIHRFDLKLPADVLLSADYVDMSAEEIYNKLPNTPPLPEWGQFINPSNNGTPQEQEAEWQVALKQAVQAAKSAGQDLGNLEDVLKVAEVKVNWREQLARLIGGIAKSDFSWLKPDPAYLHKNFIIPTLHAPSIGHLTLAIDTSGSVDNDALSQFLGELQTILENVHFEGVTVIECDTSIQHVTEYERDDLINPEVHGRGGTYFAPVFDYIKQHPTDTLIYFTDMLPNDRWPDNPGIPVFWARTTSRSAPYGEHIDLYTAS